MNDVLSDITLRHIWRLLRLHLSRIRTAHTSFPSIPCSVVKRQLHKAEARAAMNLGSRHGYVGATVMSRMALGRRNFSALPGRSSLLGGLGRLGGSVSTGLGCVGAGLGSRHQARSVRRRIVNLDGQCRSCSSSTHSCRVLHLLRLLHVQLPTFHALRWRRHEVDSLQKGVSSAGQQSIGSYDERSGRGYMGQDGPRASAGHGSLT